MTLNSFEQDVVQDFGNRLKTFPLYLNNTKVVKEKKNF